MSEKDENIIGCGIYNKKKNIFCLMERKESQKQMWML
jgi:hypothetical protein